MSDPAFVLQSALVVLMKNDNALNEVAGKRVYDTPPIGKMPAFPFIALGTVTVVADGADEVDGADTTFLIHVWSRPVRREDAGEAKHLAALISDMFDQQSLDLGDEHACVIVNHVSTSHLIDPDGLTRHSVLTFNTLTDKVA